MEPWEKETPGEESAEAYQRIVERLRALAAANRTSLERLRTDLRAVLRNQKATRRLLSEEVYGVPDGWLDDLLRVRLRGLKG